MNTEEPSGYIHWFIGFKQNFRTNSGDNGQTDPHQPPTTGVHHPRYLDRTLSGRMLCRKTHSK
ncbi:hypothetical protein DSECCO2_37410 [anaerobic digester metagenome]